MNSHLKLLIEAVNLPRLVVNFQLLETSSKLVRDKTLISMFYLEFANTKDKIDSSCTIVRCRPYEGHDSDSIAPCHTESIMVSWSGSKTASVDLILYSCKA